MPVDIPFSQAISLGMVARNGTVSKYGRNMDVDALSAPEDVWPAGGVYSGFPNIAPADGETVTAVSTSAADTAAGTGMRTITLEGLGIDGSTQTETFAMSGLVAATSTKKWYRVHGAYGASAGSGGTNAGTVTVAHSATVANIFASLTPGMGQSHNACYTVPADRIGLLTDATVEVGNSANQPQEVHAALAVRLYGTGMWRMINPHIATTSTGVAVNAGGGGVVPPLTDVSIRVISATADNLQVAGSLLFLTIPV